MIEVPASYTDETLLRFLREELTEVAAVLGWEYEAPYRSVARRALRLYGAETTAEATDATKLELLAVFAAWERACKALTVAVDSRAGSSSEALSQMWKQARTAFLEAKVDAGPYLPADYGDDVIIETLSWENDPYAARVDTGFGVSA